MTAVLQFQGADMRHVFINGEPWFVALDVCTILFPAFNRYAGTTPWLQGLDADEKRVAKRADPATLGIFEGQNMVHQLGMISESGLYKVILRARPEKNANAKAFQDWVTREVLPSIRKTGGYLLNEDMRSTAAADSREEFPLPASFSDALRKLADEVERREESERTTKLPEAAREADRSKVEFAEEYMASKGTLILREAANTFGMGQNDFIGLLIEKKVLYRNVKGQNVAVAAQLFAERFVQRTGSQNGRSYISTRVTPDGMTWIATQLMRWRPKGASGHRKGS